MNSTIDTQPKKRFFLTTFGCQMNQADGQRIRGLLHQADFIEAATEEEADLILFNTCCVREHAEERLLSRVRALQSLKQQKPSLRIAIGGCMAQKEKQHLYDLLPMIDLAFGPNDIPHLLDLLDKSGKGQPIFGPFADIGSFTGEEADGIILDRPFSALVNIIRGCTNFCSYCIVPKVRGPEVSRPLTEIVPFVRELAARGVSEITLLGQNVNVYGKDLGMTEGFAELLEHLDAVPGVRRMRFLTSHPRDFTPAAIARLARLNHLCEQFHLPVQAGSTRILGLMNRGYTRERYLELIAELRRQIPKACVTTDIICGFPSESEGEFEETLDLVRQVRFESAYTYYFSPREGTRAATLDNQLPVKVRKDRLARLIELQNRIAIEESQKLIGTVQEILVESPATRVPGHFYGKTRTGRVVDFKGDRAQIGTSVSVRITQARNWTLSGELSR